MPYEDWIKEIPTTMHSTSSKTSRTKRALSRASKIVQSHSTPTSPRKILFSDHINSPKTTPSSPSPSPGVETMRTQFDLLLSAEMNHVDGHVIITNPTVMEAQLEPEPALNCSPLGKISSNGEGFYAPQSSPVKILCNISNCSGSDEKSIIRDNDNGKLINNPTGMEAQLEPEPALNCSPLGKISSKGEGFYAPQSSPVKILCNISNCSGSDEQSITKLISTIRMEFTAQNAAHDSAIAQLQARNAAQYSAIAKLQARNAAQDSAISQLQDRDATQVSSQKDRAAAYEARIAALESNNGTLRKMVHDLQDQTVAIGLSIHESVTGNFPAASSSTTTAPSAKPVLAHSVTPGEIWTKIVKKNSARPVLAHSVTPGEVWTKVVQKNSARKPSPAAPQTLSTKFAMRKITPSDRFAEAVSMASRRDKGSDTIVDAKDSIITDPIMAAPADKSKPATRNMEYFEIPTKVPINEIKKALKTFNITSKDYETIRLVRSPKNSSIILEFYASSWIKARLTLFCEKIMGAKILKRFDPIFKSELASAHQAVQLAFHISQARTIGRILDRHMSQKCRTILHKTMQEHEIEITFINQSPHSEEAASSARTTGHHQCC
jgi:cell division protein FtsB